MFILKKFLSNNKNKVLLSLLLIGLILQFIAFETVGTNLPTNINQKVITQENIHFNEKNIKETEILIESENPPENVQEILVELQEDLKLNKEKLHALEKNNYKEFWRLENLHNEKTLKKLEEAEKKGEESSLVGGHEHIKSMSKWYHQVLNSGQDFTQAPGLNPSGLGAAQYILIGLGGLYGLILLTFICGDTLAMEMPNGLRYYHLMKKDKKVLHFQHLFIPAGFVLLLILFALLVFALFAGLQFGMGSWNFPDFVVGATYDLFQGEELLWRLLYLLLAILFITSLGQLLSQFIRKAYIPSAIIALLLVTYSVIHTHEVMKTIIKWIPLTYLDINTVLQFSNGENSWPTSGDFLFGRNSLGIGALVLLSCTIIFYSTSHFLFTKYIYRKA
ncbi:hypothetical protein AALM99_09505 [Lactococcus muris]|uniref:ABC-2 family transporter protein n=1 Tax=Lactococcus muris TaxID=2941330 RepID=A0ABV4DDK9_9LACT|nr:MULTISPECIES: hypothetical protein [Lactococcus]MBL3716584.1 hypothetical protein [Lactococcus garvieae]